jgi:hypothetical protein
MSTLKPSLDALPAEIIFLIASYFNSGSNTVKYLAPNIDQNLLSLCLVNRAIRSYVQPFLYRSIVLLSITNEHALNELFNKTASLYSALKSNPTLGDNIREINFGIMESEQNEGRDNLSGSTESELAITQSSNKIYNMLSHMIMTHMQFLRKASIVQTGYRAGFQISWEILTPLAEVAQQLEELHLAIDNYVEPKFLLDNLLPLHNLRILTFNCPTSWYDEYRPKLQAGLVSKDAKWEKLAKVSIQTDPRQLTIDYSIVLPYLSGIEELEWGLVTADSRKDEILQALPDLQTCLAPIASTLRKLVLTCADWAWLGPNLTNMQVSKLHGLRHLSISDWMIGERDNPSSIYQSLLAGDLHVLEWKFKEISYDRRLTENTVETIRQALLIAIRKESSLQIFSLNLHLLRDGNAMTRYFSIQKQTNGINSDLRKAGLVSNCSTYELGVTVDWLGVGDIF